MQNIVLKIVIAGILGLLLVLAAIGAGGVVGYFMLRYPSATCMALDLIGLCKL